MTTRAVIHTDRRHPKFSIVGLPKFLILVDGFCDIINFDLNRCKAVVPYCQSIVNGKKEDLSSLLSLIRSSMEFIDVSCYREICFKVSTGGARIQ